MANVTFTATNVQKESSDNVSVAALAEAVTAGQAVFKDADDGLLYLATAATASAGAKPASGDEFGVALAGGSTGQSVPYIWRPGDKVDFGASTFTAGQWYVVSATSGAIAPAADLASTDYSVILGYAETDAILVMHPKRSGVQLA